MLFLASIAAAVAVGLAAGGRMERLADLRVTWLGAVPFVFLAQMLAVYGPAPFSDALAIPLIVGSHAALLAIGLGNLRTPGMGIAALGIAMNLTVMVANGGLMPVAPETVRLAGREAWKVGDASPGTRMAQSKDIIKLREDTTFELLADRYWTGLPGRLGVIFSIGDVVLAVGMFVLVARTITAAAPRPIHQPQRGVP